MRALVAVDENYGTLSFRQRKAMKLLLLVALAVLCATVYVQCGI